MFTATILALAASMAVPVVPGVPVAPRVPLLVPTAAHVAPFTEPAKGETVRGTVVSNAGEPLADARVSVIIAGATTAIVTVRTAADGSFTLTLPPAKDVYELRVLCIGYEPVTAALPLGDTGKIVMQPIPSLARLAKPAAPSDAQTAARDAAPEPRAVPTAARYAVLR